MKEFITNIWEIIMKNKEIMAGIFGIQILVIIIIVVMLAIDEDEPAIRQ
ncbi:hypothetical protein [Rhodocytophaga aerolata]|jgi:hypothetical protein